MPILPLGLMAPLLECAMQTFWQQWELDPITANINESHGPTLKTRDSGLVCQTYWFLICGKNDSFIWVKLSQENPLPVDFPSQICHSYLF